MLKTSLFHAYQIATIYAPGAALIPATLVASFFSVTLAVIAAVSLVIIIVAGFVFRPYVATRLGLDRDYE